jgi:hypothetical protein
MRQSDDTKVPGLPTVGNITRGSPVAAAAFSVLAKLALATPTIL